MHIAVVTRNMCAGGAERVIAQLLQGWCERNIQCSLICMNPKEAFYSVPEAVAQYDIPQFSDNSNVDKIRKYAHLRGVVQKIAPDIVLALPEEIGIYVLPALLGTGIPVVVSERNNPWVMPYKKISRIFRSIFYPFAAGLIFQTEQAASFFPESQQKKGVVLPNPLDLSRLPAVNEYQREKIVVSAGRLEPQKNFPLLIEAFAEFNKRHPDYRLVIYGEGAEREKLENMAAEKLPVGSWSMPGKVNDLPERIGSSGIFALSSDFEGVPNVLIEAMAVGVPCVSTDCAPGGAASLIDNGENGILVPVGDADALAEGLCYMAEHPHEAAAMGEKAVQIREKLEAGQVCDRWYQYLDSVRKKNKKEQRDFSVTVRDRRVTVRYQTLLLAMFVLLTTLSGWAPALSDSTLATPFTRMFSRIMNYVCLFGIVAVYLRSPIQIKSRFRPLLFTPVIYWCMYYFLRFDKSLSINITSAVILCLFVLLNKDTKRWVYRYFRKVLVVMCLVGIISYVLYLLHIDFFFTRYPYYTASVGGEYISYGIGTMYERGNMIRLCGHYNEPGFLGTILALVLCIENLNFRKIGNAIMLVAGVLTFSLAFWIMLAVYVAIKLIPYILKSPRILIAAAVAAALYLFVLPHVKTGIESVDLLLQRLTLTSGGLAGNNRENTMLQQLFDQTMSNREFLLGNGAGYIKAQDIGTVSSYKSYVIEYGVLGFVLIYGSLLMNAIRQAEKNYNALAFIAVFALSIYQRPNVISLVYFSLLFGGIELIKYRDNREKHKKVKE